MNTARLAAQPLADGGTAVQEWVESPLSLPELDMRGCAGLVVVGAHPDDETLGFGAAMAMLAETGTEVQIVSASDGGAAFPEASRARRNQLEQQRRAELCRAAVVLGVRSPIGLGLPDGEIAQHEGRLADLLTDLLAARPAGTWCAATWRGDGHPDHEAVGRAAAVAASRTGAVLVEYPVWMWHWARPGDPAVPWSTASAVAASATALRRKTAAAECFRSQFVPPAPGVAPVLPEYVLSRLLAVGEVVFR
ncbi:LmbE family protein [Mycolicibacterium duvalii]|uniref:Acetylglucosaminylphosphatidylinositol deacetylase n=1 Tax=Mycolicibacterium duvalii TaxID=39688 RepID=A0A7I7K3Z9_9MYCO|nr:PIG-L family deacetylase [Mycolicibacterium duvalii]MCV7367603.1 PIG-L family deacetylase [Mycolicibacterium duvalii]PEG44090.1 LmbE family protein [Mycolicibacterium duvalii]BBX18807.1 acetylglucosaminylphosphatidylinositol deacetylase [Mycolicibacterium duvalii]